MKKMLECWWYGCYTKIDAGKTVGYTAPLWTGRIFFILTGTAMLVAGSLLGDNNAKTAGLISLMIGGVVFWIFTHFAFIKPIMAIARFKKRFGFVPATTSPGVEAQQRVVDQILCDAAKVLQSVYDVQGVIQQQLQNIAGIAYAVAPIEAIRLEQKLREINNEIAETKPAFYRDRDVASSPLLPVPFAVKKSYKDYLATEKGGEATAAELATLAEKIQALRDLAESLRQ